MIDAKSIDLTDIDVQTFPQISLFPKIKFKFVRIIDSDKAIIWNSTTRLSRGNHF